MRALRGGQLYFVISLLKVINGKAVQVSLASLLTVFIATRPGNLGVFRWKTGLGTCLDFCKSALGGREGCWRLERLTPVTRTYLFFISAADLCWPREEEGWAVIFCSANHSWHRLSPLQGASVFVCPQSPQQQNDQCQIESRKADFKGKDKGADMP